MSPILWCIGVVHVWANEYTDSNGVTWTWEENSDMTACINSASNYGTEVLVPGVVYDENGKGYVITSFQASSGSWGDYYNLVEKVTLPTTVTSCSISACKSLISVENTSQLKSASFDHCSSLKSLDLSSCTSVSCEKCSGLTSVKLTNKCTSVWFYGCSNLVSVGDLSGLTSVSGNEVVGSFQACK